MAKDGDRVRNPKYQKTKNDNNDNNKNNNSLLGAVASVGSKLASIIPSFSTTTATSTKTETEPSPQIEFAGEAELVVVENEEDQEASLSVTLSSTSGKLAILLSLVYKTVKKQKQFIYYLIGANTVEKPRWLILVADQSGSMQGNPWMQVQDALQCIFLILPNIFIIIIVFIIIKIWLTYLDMLETSYKSKNIRSDVIMYNGGAMILTKHCTPETFVDHIKAQVKHYNGNIIKYHLTLLNIASLGPDQFPSSI